MQKFFLKFPKEYLENKLGLFKAFRSTPNFGHNRQICCIEFSHNGKYFLTSSWDHTVKIWEFSTGKYVRTLEGLNHISNGFVISSDDQLVVGYSKNFVRVWEFTTGNIIRTIHCGEESSFTAVAISQNGKQIIVGSSSEENPKANNTQIFDIKTGNLVRTISDYNKEVNHIAVSPDGEHLVIGGGWRSDVNIYDFKTFRRETIKLPHKGHITNIHISPSSNLLICSSFDKTISIFSLKYKKLIGKIEEHPYEIGDIKASLDDKTLISSSAGYSDEENTLNIWYIQKGELIRSINGKKEESIRFSKFAISPNGKFVVAGCDSDITIWEINSGKMINRIYGSHYMSINLLEYDSDKNKIISISGTGGIETWDLSSGEIHSFLETDRIGTKSVSISADGKYIGFISGERELNIIDMNSKEILYKLVHEKKFWEPVIISPYSKYVVCMSGGISIVEIRSGKLVKTIELEGTFYSCAFNPDGSTLYLSWFDYNPPSDRGDEWEEEGMKRISMIEIPSGKFIGEFRVSGNRLRKIMNKFIKFTPDGKSFIGDVYQEGYNLYGTKIGIWDCTTGALTKVIDSKDGYINVLTVSKNGKVIATGTVDHIVRVWDLENHYCYGPFIHDSSITKITFCKNFNQIIVGDENANVFVWNYLGGQKEPISLVSENQIIIDYGKFYWEGEEVNEEEIREDQFEHIKNHIINTLLKRDMSKITEFFKKEVFEQFDVHQISKLYGELARNGINLFEVFFDVNLEFDSQLTLGDRWGQNSTSNYIRFPQYLRRDGFIKAGVMNIINRNKENEIELLIKLGFLKFLDDDMLNDLLKETDSIFSNMILRRGYMDNIISRNIQEFLKSNKQFISQLTLEKLKVVLKSTNLKEVFKLWEYGWLSKISDQELCNLLDQNELLLFDKLLKAVHIHGYEQNYDHTCALFPLLGNFTKMSSKKRDALKPNVINVIRSGNMDAIIPLVGSHYLEILDVNELTELIEDSDVRLLDILTKASKDHDSELYYYNEQFFNWIDRFNNFLLKFDYDLELIPRYESLLEFISPHRYDAKFGMESVEGTKRYEYVEIADEYFYVKDGTLDLKNFFLQDLTKIDGLFSLKTLKHLDIGYNWILELPEEIENLQSLESLIMQESRLRYLPESVGRLKKLKLLDVQGNILETLPKSLENSESLETVLLSVYKYGDHSKLDLAIKNLRNKGIKVKIHDKHWLE